ncbi:MAG: PIN domain-containing protein [Candidatus Gracilibacteria bacterium]
MPFKTPLKQKSAIFLDSSAFVALIDKGDQYHEDAQGFLETLNVQYQKIYTSNATIIETYRLVIHRMGWEKGIAFLNSIPNISCDVKTFSQDNETDARHNVEFIFCGIKITLTDAINAAIMKDLGIGDIFSFDNDYRVMGFKVMPIILDE